MTRHKLLYFPMPHFLILNKIISIWVWWYILVILLVGRLKQENTSLRPSWYSVSKIKWKEIKTIWLTFYEDKISLYARYLVHVCVYRALSKHYNSSVCLIFLFFYFHSVCLFLFCQVHVCRKRKQKEAVSIIWLLTVEYQNNS